MSSCAERRISSRAADVIQSKAKDVIQSKAKDLSSIRGSIPPFVAEGKGRRPDAGHLGDPLACGELFHIARVMSLLSPAALCPCPKVGTAARSWYNGGMGTLYVVGIPSTGPNDLTIRARRILGSAALVAAGEGADARLFLASCDISTPVAPAAGYGFVMRALSEGDVALLLPGHSPVPGPGEQGLVTAALAGGFAVVPVPGPVVSLTALVLSGLPADSFVYLGGMPREAGAQRTLLESMAAEARTLVLLVGAGELPDLLSLLHSAWGDRPLALWPASPDVPQEAWRGSLGEALQAGEALATGRAWVIIAGGASQERGLPWDEDRVRAEIQACLGRGLGVGQISRELAAPSGWARRDVYRLALEEDELIRRR